VECEWRIGFGNQVSEASKAVATGDGDADSEQPVILTAKEGATPSPAAAALSRKPLVSAIA
jgi:hypothetical protein